METKQKVTKRKKVILKIRKRMQGDSMEVDVDIPGIGVAHFWVQPPGPMILQGQRGGLDFGSSDKPVIECYGLDPADVIEL